MGGKQQGEVPRTDGIVFAELLSTEQRRVESEADRIQSSEEGGERKGSPRTPRERFDQEGISFVFVHQICKYKITV